MLFNNVFEDWSISAHSLQVMQIYVTAALLSIQLSVPLALERCGGSICACGDVFFGQ